MRLARFATAVVTGLALAAPPAAAGSAEALDAVLLPGLAGFTRATAALDGAAAADCTAAALDAPYAAAFDAWLAIGDIRIGPTETAAPAIAFWPDARGFTRRTLAGLIAGEDPVIDDPAAFAEISIAGRGFLALDMVLSDADFAAPAAGTYTCRLVQRLAADLSARAAALEAAWVEGYGAILRGAGAPGNAVFMNDSEAVRALYTQVLASLEFTADSRIARPLATLDRPMPTRAEAWRSGRSLPNALAATEAAVALARALGDRPLPATEAALDRVREAAARVSDPGFQDIADPVAWFRLEVLGQKVEAVAAAIEQEIGLPLGLTPGFNAQDGD